MNQAPGSSESLITRDVYPTGGGEGVRIFGEGRVLAPGAKADLLNDATLTDLFGMTTRVTQRGDWFAAHLD